MSGICPREGGGGGEQQQMVAGVRDEVYGGRGGFFSFYHVPQQCRREKLRYPSADDRPRWPPTTLSPPPIFFHCDAPLSASSATATSSLMPPSPSLLLNPSYNATPYETGIPPVHLFDDHPLLGGSHGHEAQDVSLSLSSPASPSHQDDQRNQNLSVCAPALTGQLPPLSMAPRMGLVPAGPFTGYATILQGSRFLRPAQQLLEEACGGGGTMMGALLCSGGEVDSLDLAADGVDDCSDNVDDSIGDGEHRGMRSRLMSMLDEVCRRYKQYYQQIQGVIASFEAVAGLSTAAPYTPAALRSLLKHFKCLKSAIAEQLQFANKAVGKEDLHKDEIPQFTIMNTSFCHQRVHCPTAINQQPIWRPQRGLPERAVTVLRSWLFEHFLHPYPTDMDKQMLAKQTGLSRNQVSNWFINARVRLWKPMVEEIHSLEVQQGHRISEHEPHQGNNNQPHFSPTYTISLNNKQAAPVFVPPKISGYPHKRLRDDPVQLPSLVKEPSNFSLQDTSAHHGASLPMGFASAAANGGISLTLGLHQNDRVCLADPLPLNVVHQFGLEENSVAYVMGGLEGHERQFGRDIDGQLLRHFVA
ncbi:hypothetical protein Taro_042898 [Colocasia esculenta]|uniref:Homeobox domain-containing protein n=1 Tax=Colocasia esculenta TaxID=4460 RepID=A0A843WI25_COLES|nr:hypothetical protein [Colocasia esculenta]